jgi:hypothetical protein
LLEERLIGKYLFLRKRAPLLEKRALLPDEKSTSKQQFQPL